MTLSLFDDTHSATIPKPSNQLTCEWQHCGLQFSNHNTLAQHLSEDHVGWKRPEYVCEWTNCSRKGVKCHSRFALVMHLRIHTGEKPFECTFANCGQSFGRMDALMRHKKAEHEQKDETVESMKVAHHHQKSDRPVRDLHPPSRRKKIPAPTTQKTSTAQRWSWTPDEADSPGTIRPTKFAPDGMSTKSKYKLAKAKLRYILQENELLCEEWASVQRRVKRLRVERKVLLQVLLSANGQAADMDTMMDVDLNEDRDEESEEDDGIQQLLSEESDDMSSWTLDD